MARRRSHPILFLAPFLLLLLGGSMLISTLGWTRLLIQLYRPGTHRAMTMTQQYRYKDDVFALGVGIAAAGAGWLLVRELCRKR